jgi:LmbE family N-acetylglucosaminyl deacetylase
MKRILLFLIILLAELSAQPSPTMSASEIQLALKKLTVTGSVLYVAAHPDDENTALLAYLSKEKLLRTGYLAMTRGDGGQNLIGTETGDLLGVIRTQELLAARAIDGAEQFFTRAIDFGYSKSSDETLEIWNKEKVLADVVWVIRKFRPDVIITRFLPTAGGHGHHLSSAILAEEAFHAAADPNRFPEQLQYVKTWQAKRILWNVFSWNRDGQNTDLSKLVSVDLGAYNPLLGQSYTEIYAKSRSMHKSQGFGAGASRGTSLNYFLHTAGDSARTDLFEGIDLTWNRIPGGKKIGEQLEEAYQNFNPEDPSASFPSLLAALKMMETAPKDPWIDVKKKDLQKIIQVCAGLWVEAIADDYSVTPGSEAELTATVINRSKYPIILSKIDLPFEGGDTLVDRVLQPNEPIEWKTKLRLPPNADYSQPYWLRNTPSKGTFTVNDLRLIGKPVEETPLQVDFTLIADNQPLEFKTPVLFRWVDRVDGELYRPLEITPKITLDLNEPVYVFPDAQTREIIIRIRANENDISGALRLKLPAGWKSAPASIQFSLQEKYEEKSVRFNIYPPDHASEGIVTPIAKVGGREFSREYTKIEYKYIPIQTLFPESQAKLVRLDLKKNNEKIAYIMGSGDEVAKNLEQIGYDVTLLSDAEIENSDLSKFDVIITGIRAYNTDKSLAKNFQRLLEFVNSGGTLIDQYNTTWGLPLESIGPYPFKISHDRVSVEGAPVQFVNPQSPLLNYPNKITMEDFDGWIQERGLYFANKWDSTHYQPILTSHDPGETPTSGGMLYAKHGKGHYIYSGLSWFRELPAGVPGAYRLFVNLISIGSQNGRKAELSGPQNGKGTN